MAKVHFILLLCFLLVPHQVRAQEMVFVAKEEGTFLSYKITPRTKSEIFWTKVVDMLRAGKTLKITHTAHLLEREGVFGSKKKKQVWRKYLRYNAFENTYFYGTEESQMVPTADINKIKKFLFTIEDKLFAKKKLFKTAHLYEVRVRLKVKELNKKKGFWLIAPFKKILRPTLTRRFTYVAR